MNKSERRIMDLLVILGYIFGGIVLLGALFGTPMGQ